MATLEQINQFQQGLESLSLVSASQLSSFWPSLDWSNPVYARDQLLDFYLEHQELFNEQGAFLATDFYRNLRRDTKLGKPFEPTLVSTIDEDQMKANIRYSITPVFRGGNPASALRNVKRTSYDHLAKGLIRFGSVVGV